MSKLNALAGKDYYASRTTMYYLNSSMKVFMVKVLASKARGVIK
jgi:hypothetical protein